MRAKRITENKVKYEKKTIKNPYCVAGRKSRSRGPDVGKTNQGVIGIRSVTRVDGDWGKSYKVVSQDDYKEFIYDIGLLPELLEHDLAEARDDD